MILCARHGRVICVVCDDGLVVLKRHLSRHHIVRLCLLLLVLFLALLLEVCLLQALLRQLLVAVDVIWEILLAEFRGRV